jgi:two-component system cell cycle response regulator
MVTDDHIRGAKILVVDDCERNLWFLEEILRLDGYSQVSACTEPHRVAPMHRKNHYDLILLDMHMPDMNGLSVMKALQATGMDPYLPVLAITGDKSLKRAVLQSGARDFITKPYDPAELVIRMRNALEVRLLYKAAIEHGRIQEERALHDPLTGLSNRRLLQDRIEHGIAHAVRDGRRMTLMYFDLDGFKQVNDRHGHLNGDRLLMAVAQRLQKNKRQEDTLARVGGDEFILLLPHTANRNDVITAATRILQELKAPFDINGTELSAAASIGIAFYPDDGHDGTSLIAAADKALYMAKRTGKNRYAWASFTPDNSPQEAPL